MTKVTRPYVIILRGGAEEGGSTCESTSGTVVIGGRSGAGAVVGSWGVDEGVAECGLKRKEIVSWEGEGCGRVVFGVCG